MENLLHPGYKFFSLNQNLYNSLINNTLWFSRPSRFNDPFDCNLSIKTEYSYDEMLVYIKLKGLNPDEYPFLKEDFAGGRIKIPEFEEHVLEVKTIAAKHGICCFTRGTDNLLLWSHYANSHRGVCLQFDLDELFKVFRVIIQVKYQQELPFPDLLINPDKAIIELLTTKSKHWEYEQELRAIEINEGLKQFPREALRGVIFGLRTTDEERLTVMNLIYKLGYKNVNFFICKMSDKEFAVDLQQIKLVLNHEVINL